MITVINTKNQFNTDTLSVKNHSCKKPLSVTTPTTPQFKEQAISELKRTITKSDTLR